MNRPATHRSARALALSLAAGLALSGCTLLGVDYDSSSTETSSSSGTDDRLAAMESRLERLEQKIDALGARSR